MFEVETSSNSSTENGFFRKLANGDFGLAKTYWVYGMLVGIGVNIVSNLISSTAVLVVLFLAYTAYSIPVAIGTWRAADKYQGPLIWAALAKVAIILGVIMLAIVLLSVIVLLGSAIS